MYTSISNFEITFSVKETDTILLSTLYIDTGDNFNEDESIERSYKKIDDTFITHFKLKKFNPIKRIRFDPPSHLNEITIKSIKIDNHLIDLDTIFQNPSLKVYDINISKHNGFYHLHLKGDDPHILLIPHLQKLLRNNIFIFIIIAIMSLVTLMLIQISSRIQLFTKLRKKVSIPSMYLTMQNIFWTTFLYFIFSILITKTFVTLLNIFYYQQTLSLFDIMFTYTIDILIAILFGSIGILSLYILKKMQTKKVIFNILKISSSLSTIIQILLYILLLLLSLTLLLFSLYYLLSGYIYMEWGAFIEPHHLKALQQHGGHTEFLAFFFQLKTYIFIILIITFLYLSYKFLHYLNTYKPHKKIILFFSLFMMSFLLLYFILKPMYLPNPSTNSPLLMIGNTIEEDTSSINDALYKTINISHFTPLETNKIIPKKYTKYHGIAQDMNLIIYIMESVRKKSVSLYGYTRNTMPFLTNMAKNALVFHNATVNQPRSMKTMGSLMLGTYPDPRTNGITWRYKDIKQHKKDNLFNTLLENEYQLYFGIMQEDFGGDGFKSFIKGVSHNHITLQDPIFLYKNNFFKRDLLDERILTDNFLQWSASKKDKFAAILWSKSAHSPYLSQIKKFTDGSQKDDYDNCLLNIDNALKNLVEGLKKQNKLENTLILILGDHGEALNEKMDFGHGNFLYEHSLKIPLLIYNPKVLKQANMYQRFQPKDIANTLFYMLGIEKKLHQSINIFLKTPKDKIYLSNIYQDYKLGLIYDHFKFIYRPQYNINYLFDLKNDPDENDNIIHKLSKEKMEKLQQETLKWYKYQINYLNKYIY